MKWRKWAVLTASAMLLAACANGGNDNANGDGENQNDDAAQTEETAQNDADQQDENQPKISGPEVGIKETIDNDGEPIEGGTLKVALGSDTPFQGIFSSEYAVDATDYTLLDFSHEDLFQENPDRSVSDDGIAKQIIDEDEKTVTYQLRENAKWSDGEPLTADDIIFTHEVLASPDYTGIRYTQNLENIIGLKEFHEGQADHIEGIEKVDDHTVKFHLNEVNISLKYGNGGPWHSALPKHYLEDVPVAELESSPKLRKNPVGLGPFRVAKVVDGESVEYEANEYYYAGRPKIDKIELTRVPTVGIDPALQNHEYDLVFGGGGSSSSEDDLPGYQFLTTVSSGYRYLGFKLGKFDEEKGENIPDPNAKLANPKLRQAFGYAIDNDLVGKQFYQGYSWNANSKISPNVEGLYDPEQPGFYYDPDKAKQLLDEAGYKDVNDDGYVEDPDGNELTFTLAVAVGGDTAEPVAQYYIQALKDVGLHVELLEGRLQDPQSLSQRLRDDDPAIDLFLGGWGLGRDPWPYNLEGRESPLNYSRYATEEQDALFEAMVSEQAFHDPEYQAEQYKQWQQYIVDDPQTIPLLYSLDVSPVNNRIKHYSDSPEESTRWNEIELTADEPLGE